MSPTTEWLSTRKVTRVTTVPSNSLRATVESEIMAGIPVLEKSLAYCGLSSQPCLSFSCWLLVLFLFYYMAGVVKVGMGVEIPCIF